MSVYVDSMKAKLGLMLMCHMVADDDAELHAMADSIGVKRKWHQKAGTPHSHYDICQAKRTMAIAKGAIEINNRELVKIIKSKRQIKTPYHQASYQVYFAVIRELGICSECVEEDPINTGGTRDTEKGAKLYRAIYEVLK